MRYFLPFALIILASPALSQDASGFYAGVDIQTFDTDFDNLSVTADGTGIGLHAGYRYAFSDTFFAEGEVFASSLNGETSSGNTDFKSLYGLTAGIGTYFTPQFSGMVFAGVAGVETENVATGSDTEDGSIIGIAFGYDITSQDSVSLRFSRISVDGTSGDIDTDAIGIRYSRRF